MTQQTITKNEFKEIASPFQATNVQMMYKKLFTHFVSTLSVVNSLKCIYRHMFCYIAFFEGERFLWNCLTAVPYHQELPLFRNTLCNQMLMIYAEYIPGEYKMNLEEDHYLIKTFLRSQTSDKSHNTLHNSSLKKTLLTSGVWHFPEVGMIHISYELMNSFRTLYTLFLPRS